MEISSFFDEIDHNLDAQSSKPRNRRKEGEALHRALVRDADRTERCQNNGKARLKAE